MHCLYGLKDMGMKFELKGGTSLSKGYGIINRFSEDIDICIHPPDHMNVKTGHNQDKPPHCKSRKDFYDWLATTIAIGGIVEVSRDEAFDDKDHYRSGGIRLHYKTAFEPLRDLKEGILLEAGFDDVTPNRAKDISSWAYDHAANKFQIKDNRAEGVPCYLPGYTLVEKLQTISTKYRKQQESGSFPMDLTRHYYDVSCLLQVEEVQGFIGTEKYQKHKEKRFRTADNPVIANNEAFLLSDPSTFKQYDDNFKKTSAIYFKDRPEFQKILETIQRHMDRL